MAAALSLLSTTNCAGVPVRPAPPAHVVAQPVDQWHELTDWRSQFKAASFTSTSGVTIPYAIAKLPGAAIRPLVLVLPGKFEMGADNTSQLTPFAAAWVQFFDDDKDDDPAPIVVAPQVSERSVVYGDCLRRNCKARPGPSFAALLEFVDHWRDSGLVDPNRIYLVGFSMGGGTALQLVQARPTLFAHVAAFGSVPPPHRSAAAFRSERLLLVQGSKDRRHPLSVLKRWFNALIAAGGNAKLDVRAGMKHKVPDDMIVDKGWRSQFLQQRRKGQAATAGS